MSSKLKKKVRRQETVKQKETNVMQNSQKFLIIDKDFRSICDDWTKRKDKQKDWKDFINIIVNDTSLADSIISDIEPEFSSKFDGISQKDWEDFINIVANDDSLADTIVEIEYSG